MPVAPRTTVALLLLASLATGSLAASASTVEPSWQRMVGVPTGEGRVLSPAEAATLPPTIQDGIGPGSALQMGVGDISSVCTASFLLRDPTTGQYYLSTAGHCLVVDAEDPTPVTGATHPDMVNDRVDVCVEGCINNGLGLGTYVSLQANGAYHPVAFAKSNGVGDDFGLIALPPDVHGLLRPEMPQWGGPTGVAAGGGLGDLVAHYGHGALLVPGVAAFVTRTPADQGRLATLSSAGDGAFEAVGHVTGGDSGSGASLAELDAAGIAHGTQALGTITHSIVYAGAPILSGTLLTHGFEMARATTGLELELVPAGDPLPTEPTAAAPPALASNITVTSPADGAAISTGDKRVSVKGAADRGGGPLANGTQVQVAIDDAAFGFASRIPIAGNATWAGVWDLAGVPVGKHTVRARLVAADGSVLDQQNVTVTLQKGAATPAGTGSRTGTGATPAAASSGTTSQAPFGLVDEGKRAPGQAPLLLGAALAVAATLRRRR